MKDYTIVAVTVFDDHAQQLALRPDVAVPYEWRRRRFLRPDAVMGTAVMTPIAAQAARSRHYYPVLNHETPWWDEGLTRYVATGGGHGGTVLSV